jgi:hypothetical protein
MTCMKCLHLLRTALPLLALLFAPIAWGQNIVIDEIMFHPSSQNSREEYLELYNAGTTNVTLSGWKFTKGISFTIPSNTVLKASNYLVIAGNRQAFTNKYPGVTNYVGEFVIVRMTNLNGFTYTNFENTLSNTREELKLEDALGNTIDSLTYAEEGDWGVRQRGLNDGGYQGWKWLSTADGLGKSLELINVNLPNEHGHNWLPSITVNGTPGVANSVASTNGAPLIIEATHSPIIPLPSDDVAVTARIIDESPGVAARLFWRVNNGAPPSFINTNMFDDGAHGDGTAGDGIYGALIPAQGNFSIVEFYVEAIDISNKTNSWPRPAVDTDQVTLMNRANFSFNALYQVDSAGPTNNAPFYKLILTPGEYTELGNLLSGSPNSDAAFNATFISIDVTGITIRYLCSIRNRGHGSRFGTPHNYRIGFNNDVPWKDVSALNLNARTVPSQHFGSTLARKSGAAGGNSHAAQLRINGGAGPGGTPTLTYYAANEDISSAWAQEHFPNDSGGNAYKAVRDITPPNFDYRGSDSASYMNTYFKESNSSEQDYWDLITMLQAMGENQTNLFTTARARAVINVEQWLLHLAVMNLFGNNETGLNTGYNDDYYMYRGVNDPRFILMYHDLDTILGQSGSLGTSASIFTATQMPGAGSGTAMNWFMHWPDFEPIYYLTLQRLLNTTFAKTNFDAVADQTLAFYVPAGTISAMKTWMDGRRTYVQGVLNSYFAANPQPPTATISGEPRSPTPFNTATLTVGGSNVVSYRFKLNNGTYGAETPVATPISLPGLANGSTNTVYVMGKSAAGVWQDGTNAPTVSKIWVVNTALSKVRLNEVLADNVAAVNNGGTFPDVIELYNEGATSVDIGGLRISDDPAVPGKFVFPSPTIIGSGSYLILYANNSNGAPGIHLGFNLDADGEGVYLFDAASNLIDSVTFGLQLADLSVGRFGSSGEWKLCQPSFGGTNVAKPTGDLYSLKINEWLASGLPPFVEDFVELYNPNSAPVDFGNCYFTDDPIGEPTLHRMPPLTFIQSNAFLKLNADGNNGPRHLNFSLSGDQEEIGLLDPGLNGIDCVIFGPQTPGVSQGRCPDGVTKFVSLASPSPAAPNLCPPPPTSGTFNILPYSASWQFNQIDNLDGVVWTATNYNDSAWATGQGVFGTGSLPSETVRTIVNQPFGRTIYYRTKFVIPPNPPFAALFLSHYIDDGAVLYLNGKEAYKYNITNGMAVSFNTYATNVSGTPIEAGGIVLPLTNVFVGTNYIAVEVHQANPTSPDTFMGVKIDALTNSAASAGLMISEVLANNESLAEADGSTPDWVEIYNPSASAIDLAGLSLTDDVANQRRWVFLPNSIAPARGFYRVRCDADAPVSATNTGFGLKASGDELYLFTSSGGLLDSVLFGLQAGNYSIGRVPTGSTNWVLNAPTPGASNNAAALGSQSALRVNEWMANPVSGDDWFEIFNTNALPVLLSGLWLTDDLTTPTTRMQYQIPALSFIGVGAYAFQEFKADGNPQNGADHVNFSLKAGGESVGISQTNGTQIDGFTFGSQTIGVSQGRFPDGATSITNFTISQSPGDMNWLPMTNVVINEVLTHTDLPLEDAIEILNTNAAGVNITGWYLSNQKENLKKYQITNLITLTTGAFRVFYETQFNDMAFAPNNFTLNAAHGDNVYLSQATNGVLTGYRAQVDFGAAENGVSFGRYRTSVGNYDFVAMSARSFGVDNPANVALFRTGAGKTNPYPLVGPVVISEIMYRPPLLGTNDNTRDEFIELRNLTASAVALYDTNYPTNHWRIRGGVEFDFPPNVTLGATGSLLVVGFDPANDAASLAAFKSAYGISNPITILGPWSGKLGNTNESVSLQKPDAVQLPPHPDAGFVPYVLVEKISYTNGLPWPNNVSMTGRSLQRVSLTGYGNDPTNWVGATATPAPAGNADTDSDGMPDWWELTYDLDPGRAADANEDADDDGMTNLQEYLAGTNPQDPSSRLAITISLTPVNAARLQFDASATLSYTLQYRASLSTGSWLNLTSFVAAPSNRTLVVTNAVPAPPRFYRVSRP